MVAGGIPGRMEGSLMDDEPIYIEDEHPYSGLLEEE
jgi:hypothetical protein